MSRLIIIARYCTLLSITHIASFVKHEHSIVLIQNTTQHLHVHIPRPKSSVTSFVFNITQVLSMKEH